MSTRLFALLALLASGTLLALFVTEGLDLHPDWYWWPIAGAGSALFIYGLRDL